VARPFLDPCWAEVFLYIGRIGGVRVALSSGFHLPPVGQAFWYVPVSDQ